MTVLVSRRALILAGAGLLGTVIAAPSAMAQSHTSGESGHAGGSGRGRGGVGGGHSSGHDPDTHTDDVHTDEGHTDGSHADKIDQGGKGKGPKYRGGRDVSHPSERMGHSLEDRVLRKE